MKRRFKLTLEYNGTPFYGWQRQQTHISVQQVLEEAVEKFCGQKVNAYVAGRTDAGVHARAQVCHIDITINVTPFRVQEALNHFLRDYPVVVIDIAEKDDDFHARFSATWRAYEYIIFNRRAAPALEAETVWHVPVPLDSQAMHTAAQVFIGTHDFTSFRASECQAQSPIKTLDKFEISQQGHYIKAQIQARSFLHHQVRNMMGSLSLIGRSKWSISDLEKALAAKNRCAAGITAPASGLFLVGVGY